jgi:hypothetical protein
VIPWVYDDGGRADAGFKGKAGDCVARAIAIAAAIATAGEKWRECIKVNAESKTEEVLRWLKRTS